ncbi:hypothetical protein ABIB68_007364 [Bradyrhizobium sp. F1.2.2]
MEDFVFCLQNLNIGQGLGSTYSGTELPTSNKSILPVEGYSPGAGLTWRPTRLIARVLRTMPRSFRSLLILLTLSAGLSGCGTVNEKLSSGMGDYVPQWAGGLPADAPPRAGTPQYDAYMKERERKRLMPAADREKEEQAQKGATGSASGTAVR